jgi:hypothetical protein
MKLTKTKLKRIIKEELNKVLKEEEDIVTVSMPKNEFWDDSAKPDTWPSDRADYEWGEGWEINHDVIDAYVEIANKHGVKAEKTDEHIIFTGTRANMLAFKDEIRRTDAALDFGFAGSDPRIPWPADFQRTS